MRLAEFPVDSTPSTYRGDGVDEEEEKSSVRRRRRRREAESGEPFWAEQELTGPKGWSDQSQGPLRALTTGAPMLVTARQGPPGDSQGYTSQMWSSIRHEKWLKGRRSGWLGRKLTAIMILL